VSPTFTLTCSKKTRARVFKQDSKQALLYYGLPCYIMPHTSLWSNVIRAGGFKFRSEHPRWPGRSRVVDGGVETWADGC